ncbi:MAG TPA: polysaccharide deacetylase family protein [Eoetvoesiella sp.]
MQNAQVYIWLQAILAERFGAGITLSEPQQGYAVLSVAGSPLTIRIIADPATFTRADSNLPFSSWDGAGEGWKMPLKQALPAPGLDKLRTPLIEQSEAGFIIHYDILGLTYWMLSRQEEVDRTEMDHHGRFPATASHACKHNYLERPLVDEWLDVLGQVFKRLWPGISLNKHTFSMRVSHDVDWASRYGFFGFMLFLRTMACDVIKQRNPGLALKASAIWYRSHKHLHPQDPYNTFDWIMDASELHGLVSAFYFICGRTNSAMDTWYEPEHPAIRELLRHIHARGHEIGLHPSYNTYKKPEIFISEAQRLKRICAEEGIEQSGWGGRMHILRWATPSTLYGWEQSGMTYDSTLTYADRPGFRCGTCFEYPAFDPVRGVALNLRLRPLVAMESTIIASRYMGLGTSDVARAKFLELKSICRAVNGCFTLLWHNSELDSPQKQQLYISLLA